MVRAFHEPREFDEFDIFDHGEAVRRQNDRAETIRRGEERIARENAAAAQRKLESDARAMQYNRDQRLREYQTAGVRPLRTDFDGYPTCSLPFLLSLGWTIVEISGEKKLVEPPPPKPQRPSGNNEQGT